MTRATRILSWVLLLAVICIGLIRLRLDVEVLNLLPSDIPAVKGLRAYQEHFTDARELIIAVRASSAEEAEATARLIAGELRGATQWVSHVTWQPPWLEHPGESAELMAYLWFNQPPEVFDRLVQRLDPDEVAKTLASTREQLATSMSFGEIARLSYDPLGLTQLPSEVGQAAPAFGEGNEIFASSDGTFRILFVQAATELSDYRRAVEWMGAINAIVEGARREHEIDDDVTIGYTGGPAFVAEISTGMRNDIRKSVGAALTIIVLLFWWAHRRLRPLLWLLTLLLIILTMTLALGGLIFGTVNVVSVGFAAILLGLSVDYALVLYQEARHSPGVSPRTVRRAVARGIVWSAATTAGAFAILNFGGLPGLAQLGSLVAIGIALAAYVMIRFFLRPLAGVVQQSGVPRAVQSVEDSRASSVVGWCVTVFLAILATVVLIRQAPGLDYTTRSLRPQESPAYESMEAIRANIGRDRDPDWLVISAANESELADRLAALRPVLERARSEAHVESFTLPESIAPRPAYQEANRPAARVLSGRAEMLHAAAREHGFTPESLSLTLRMMESWGNAAATDGAYLPGNHFSRWVVRRAVARDGDRFYALGLVYGSGNPDVERQWTAELPAENVWLAGWERLGSDLLRVVQGHFWRVMLPMMALLLACLWLAFRNIREVCLSLATLSFSALLLWAVMGIAGWSWNLMNLLALPLLLGAGVDYSIHMQLGLRRAGGRFRETRRTIGRAILLCAATTATGFGSNALSSNAGVKSLGLVCAAGVACAFVTSFFLLPVWWRAFAGGMTEVSTKGETTGGAPGAVDGALSAPSSLYRPEFWMMGLGVVRIIPRRLCLAAGQVAAGIYWRLARARREVVIENLRPALKGDRSAAETMARRLLRQFVIKVVDLWRYEAGLPIQNSFGTATGWEHFAAALQEKRGVLLLTPHLGNWEFGGPWLTQKGVPLQVVTLAEPGSNFTQLRQASRARWNIETLVIGNDPFAFVEIIRRLEAGSVVALLIDRPSPSTAVSVELFGAPFPASIAAAELARASGCVLLPVYLPREGDTYAAHVLPPISYDRPALRDPAARQQLTQKIVRAFEPAIQQHLDQWYHFIPIWPRS